MWAMNRCGRRIGSAVSDMKKEQAATHLFFVVEIVAGRCSIVRTYCCSSADLVCARAILRFDQRARVFIANPDCRRYPAGARLCHYGKP